MQVVTDYAMHCCRTLASLKLVYITLLQMVKGSSYVKEDRHYNILLFLISYPAEYSGAGN